MGGLLSTEKKEKIGIRNITGTLRKHSISAKKEDQHCSISEMKFISNLQKEYCSVIKLPCFTYKWSQLQSLEKSVFKSLENFFITEWIVCSQINQRRRFSCCHMYDILKFSTILSKGMQAIKTYQQHYTGNKECQ